MKAFELSRLLGLGLGLVLVVFALAGTSVAGSKVSEEQAWLGVQLQALNEDLKEAMEMDEDQEGVLIAEVLDDSPADEAGLEDGDVVTSIDGDEMTSVKQVVAAIQDRSPGDRVEIKVLRDGRRRTLNVTLGEAEKKHKMKRLYVPDVSHLQHLGQQAHQWVQTWQDEHGYLGVSILDLNDDLGQYFKVKEGEGVLITEVHEDSPAEDAGLLAGDVVLEFDGKTVKNTEKFRKYVARTEPGEDVTMVVKRKGRKKTIEAEIGEMEAPMGRWMESFGYPSGRKRTSGRIVIKDEDGEVEVIDLPEGSGPFMCKPHASTPGGKCHRVYIGDLEELEGLEELEELEDLHDVIRIHGLEEFEDYEELEDAMKELQKEMEELRRELEKLKR